MAKKKRRNEHVKTTSQKREAQYRKVLREVNHSRLAELILYGGRILVENRLVMLIKPYEDMPGVGEMTQMDFDREICAAGLPEFIRPVMAEDWPDEVMNDPKTPGCVLVQEQKRGIRIRRAVDVIFPDHN